MLIVTVGGIAALVVLVVVLVQRSRARSAAAYAASGLVPVDPEPALRDAILGLWTQQAPDPNVKLQLLTLHRLEGASDETYSARVRRTVKSQGTERGRFNIHDERGVFVRSARLQGPAFEIIPKASSMIGPAGAGTLMTAVAGMADQAAQAVLSQFGSPLEWSDVPEFGAAFFVAASEPAPARAFLTPQRRQALAPLLAAQVSNRPGRLLLQRPAGEILQRGEPLEARLAADLALARAVVAALSL